MLNFKNLTILDSHISYIQKKLNRENIFLVGGCVRDLLLDINTTPMDIDLCMTGDPKDIYKKIDKTELSHFITEKYGTITLIPKEKLVSIPYPSNTNEKKLQYELTPFRFESNYSDKRHPDEVQRSDNILEDAKRREFTISCIYYFSDIEPTSKPIPHINIQQEHIEKNLDKHGFEYISDLKLRIIQDSKIISELFPCGIYDTKGFEKLIENYANAHQTNKPTIKNKRILIDPYKGIQDLINGKLKCVGNPDERFQEDALRLIRAIRFVNVINQKLGEKPTTEKYIDFEKDTRKSLQKNFALIQYMPKERIKIELDKVFSKGNPFGFVAILDALNMLKFLFPSVYALKGVDQPIRYHPFDTYHHTLLVVFEGQKISKNPLVRRALLYHDVGKPDQYSLYQIGLSRDELQETQYLNHRNTSGKIAKEELQKLCFSNKEIEEIVRYIDNHHKPEEILNAKTNNRRKKLKKMLSEAGIERIQNLFDMVLGDRLGHYNPIQPPEIAEIEILRKMTLEIYKTEGQFTPKHLAIKGDDIMHGFKLKPSPKIGELLDTAFERVLQNTQARNNKTDIINYLQKKGKTEPEATKKATKKQ